MNRPPEIPQPESQHQFKVFLPIGDFARRLQKLIAAGNQGAVDYALQNLYVGIENVLSVNHVTQITSSEER